MKRKVGAIIMLEQGLFADEPVPESGVEQAETWKVLIVDDDNEVHALTRLVLAEFSFEGKALNFISAHSGKEAAAILEEHDDIALAFVDVVMETEFAGLELIRYVRDKLKNTKTRLVLRTGQPGEAPARNVVVDYDINDYKEKTELTADRLFLTTIAALRAYRDLDSIDRSRVGLEQIIVAGQSLFEATSLRPFCQGLLAQLVSVLRLDPKAFLDHGGALAAVGVDGGGYRVVAGTGCFSSAAGRAMNDIIPPGKLPNPKSGVAEHEDIFQDDTYVGYFERKGSLKNLIMLKDYRPIEELDRNLLRVFSSNLSVAFDNLSLRQDIMATQSEVLCTLGAVVESRSKETAYHVRRVAEMSMSMAQWMGVQESEVHLLHEASPMHDVGKIAIPDAILNKPARLTPEEMLVMKTHAEIGAELMSRSERPLFKAASIVAGQHHEKWDGTGYPRGTNEKEIHIFGRITALADVFDALVSRRCYKEPWKWEDAIELVRNERGKHFDPALVDQFMDHQHVIRDIQSRLAD